MAEYGGWVTLGDESPKPPEKSGSWLKPIHLTKSELLRDTKKPRISEKRGHFGHLSVEPEFVLSWIVLSLSAYVTVLSCFVTPWKAGEPARRFGVRMFFVSHSVPIVRRVRLPKGNPPSRPLPNDINAIEIWYLGDAGVGKGQVSQMRKSFESLRTNGLKWAAGSEHEKNLMRGGASVWVNHRRCYNGEREAPRTPQARRIGHDTA